LRNKKNIQIISITLIGIIAINWLSSSLYKRFDLTQDKRYTLSLEAKNTIASLQHPLYIDLYLDGNLPSEFKRLKIETLQLLEEFSSYNKNIVYQFYDGKQVKASLENQFAFAEQELHKGKTLIQEKKISEEEFIAIGKRFENARKNIQDFSTLKAAQVETRKNGAITTQNVYPWAYASYGTKKVPIALLKNQLGASQEERVNASIQNLEYAFADAFGKLTQTKKRRVGVLKGNSEIEDRYLADYISTLKEYYHIGPFTLDSIAISPQRTLESLTKYDLIVVAQPKTFFTDQEKYVLDQYIMNGGASLWLIDATQQQMDSTSGKTFAFPRDLGLNDFFFKYGIRINNNLVKDIYATPITVASGEGTNAQYNKYPWLYSPLSSSNNTHAIVTNIEAVKFNYASSIDTLPNSLKKTILLGTSPITKLAGLPAEIDIDKEIPKNLKIINEGPDLNVFNAGEQPLAVLVEGEFSSVYANRIKPFNIPNDKVKSIFTKMVVISDGDLIKNQFNNRGKPFELGYDKWTHAFYGNKEFLLNTTNYLLDDSGLINIRTKEVSVPFLDSQKVTQKRVSWQIVNLLLPLGLLIVFGIIFQFLRKKKYTR